MNDLRPRSRRSMMGIHYESQEVTGDFRMALAYQSTFECVIFIDCRMEKGAYQGSTFKKCHFEGCKLDLCDFNAARFEECSFTNCQLDMATFHSAVLEDCQFIMGRAEYASFWNAMLKRVKFDLELHGADLRFSVAEDVDYGDSNLWGASINISCVNFVDKEASERQVKILLALIAATKGNDEIRAKLLEIAGPHYANMALRLAGK